MDFTRPLHLCQQIIVLDGLTGTGKTMFSPLLSSFERVQNARFEYMFEYLCISAQYQKLSSDAATSLLNMLADIKYYDGMISREVNFRPKDLSSVFNGSKSVRYLRQLFMVDGKSVEARIAAESPALLLVTHQLLGCMQPALDAFGERLKIIEMVRHPLYLLEHWHSYIDMHGNNARDFTIWLDYEGQRVPWFAGGWEQAYVSLPSFDRVVYAIKSLMQPVFSVLEDSQWNKTVMFIPFEHFVLKPDTYLADLENALSLSMTDATRKVLKDQRVPRPTINAGPQKSIYKRYGLRAYDKTVTHQQDYERLFESAKSQCSAESFGMLEQVVGQYEKTFGLWF